MTLPQDTTGLRLHPGVKPGSSASLILSIVMTHAASSPAAPVTTSSQARARLPPTFSLTARRRPFSSADTGPVAKIVILNSPIG
jgi:hypothetical protein